jgi:predicted nucleotidyltransferase
VRNTLEFEKLFKAKLQNFKWNSHMKNIEEIKKKLEELKPLLRERFKVKSIGIFGSYVKGKEKKRSDLDILVEFRGSASLSLLEFVGLENYLSEILGVKVDLVEKSTLKPRIGKHILEEVVKI